MLNPIDLSKDFDRKAKVTEGETNAGVGVELLPWGNGYLYDGWGQWRARLQKLKVRSKRDYFYFHDSYKGYSHGCIETETDLYYDLRKFQKMGIRSIKVLIKYNPRSTTNGGTKKDPPPWRYRDELDLEGNLHPIPKPGAFPDKRKI